ncbi:MAG: aminopeptidase [Bacilli bacterium]|nr:aminopeptidase [Bacilli bacterium]
MKKTVLKKYARLIAQVGANVQKGQDVVIYTALDQEELAVLIAEECYKLKARQVFIEWTSTLYTRLSYKKETVKTLSTVHPWRIEKEKYYNKELPAFIYIDSDDPDGLKGLNPKKMAMVRKNIYPILKPFRDERDNKYQWIIAGASSPKWAKKVFPNLPTKQAVNKLWDAILYTSRCNDDPIIAWEEHNNDLEKRSSYLNSLDIDYLEYHSKNGTDFKVWLNKDVKWEAGGEKTLGSNIFFNPNIPTEECFTTPIKGRAEGKVVATKPLSYQGQLIENFSFIFKEGKVVEVHAEKGEELLKEMVNMDEGASYLGEVALVPFDSPINNLNILFFSTLYDENAACHLALGAGFTNLYKDYEKYSLDELKERGINDSSIHVDFMIGSDDLSIKAHLKDGRVVDIFKEGNWAF